MRAEVLKARNISAVNSTQMSSFAVMFHVHRDRFIAWLPFDGYRSDSYYFHSFIGS